MKRLMMLMVAATISFAAIAQSKNVNKANTAFSKKEYAEAIIGSKLSCSRTSCYLVNY